MTTAKIKPGFWKTQLDTNASRAIFHQWEQLEASGCIQNFRIASGEAEGFREGWFFADSDAFKWLDAAACILTNGPHPALNTLVDDFIALIARAQQPDGYIYTYNQIHFPDGRWINLQIEHELYCHGHLIEAGVSHYNATGQTTLLDIARLAADRIVEDFKGKGPEYTPGHQEIEIALLRLHQTAPNGRAYLEMAQQFIEQRGYNSRFGMTIFKENLSVGRRGKIVDQRKQAYLAENPEFTPYQLPSGNHAPKPSNSTMRWMASALSGKYFQQHAPIREQTIPVGHAVRFGYLETAAAMLARETNDKTHNASLAQAWDHMVTRRMYVTGGLGAEPGQEGFGRDYELDPEYAYAETCAALASMFWSWEMAQLTGEAKYSDLLEWQLYNAAGVGMGLDGTTYLYNNPLACRGGVTRQPWYAVPCCPSNLSRTWASLGKYVYSATGNDLWIHQYISSEFSTKTASITIDSAFPYKTEVTITVEPTSTDETSTIFLRQPSWSAVGSIWVNDKSIPLIPEKPSHSPTASGYDPRASRWIQITREWQPGDLIRIKFDQPIQLRCAHPKVKGHADKTAVTRGPLIYCLESIDNPNVDLFSVQINTESLCPIHAPDLLGGITIINGTTTSGAPVTFIPYHLWGNRGPSQMNVWVNI